MIQNSAVKTDFVPWFTYLISYEKTVIKKKKCFYLKKKMQLLHKKLDEKSARLKGKITLFSTDSPPSRHC